MAVWAVLPLVGALARSTSIGTGRLAIELGALEEFQRSGVWGFCWGWICGVRWGNGTNGRG